MTGNGWNFPRYSACCAQMKRSEQVQTGSTTCAAYLRISVYARVGELTGRIGIQVATIATTRDVVTG